MRDAVITPHVHVPPLEGDLKCVILNLTWKTVKWRQFNIYKKLNFISLYNFLSNYLPYIYNVQYQVVFCLEEKDNYLPCLLQSGHLLWIKSNLSPLYITSDILLSIKSKLPPLYIYHVVFCYE